VAASSPSASTPSSWPSPTRRRTTSTSSSSRSPASTSPPRWAVQRGLTAKHFAGNVSYSGLSVDYEDYVDQATAEILLNWRQQVYNPQTKQLGPASQYKRNAQVLFTSPGGLILRKLNILGMFPLSVKIGPQADTQTDGLSMINCQFQYDECTPGDGFSTTNWAQLAGSQIAVGGFLTGSAGLGLSATVQAGVSGTAGTGFNA